MTLPDRTVLDSGAVVVYQRLASNPFIAFRGSLPAGVAQEGAERGVAEFTSRLLLGGNRRASAARIADRLEGMGSVLEFWNSEETLGFHGRCTREAVAETLRILVDCLASPTFPAREVERVRTGLLNDLRQEADDTRHRATQALAELVFPAGHPYGRDPKGDASRVRAIRRGDLAAFHEAHVSPEHLILALSGDVDRGLVERTIAPALARLRGDGEAPSRVHPPSAHRRRTVGIPMPHKAQADLAVGRPAVSRHHEDFYTLHLANLLFGRMGLGGRLGKSLRDDQGLAYYAFSSLDARTVAGQWSVGMGVNPTNLEKAARGVRAEMERLRTEPFSSQELADGRGNQVGALQVSLERNAEVAAELHRMEYYGLGMDFLERYPDIVRDLTGERVRAIARATFDPAACSMVVAGPLGKSRPRL